MSFFLNLLIKIIKKNQSNQLVLSLQFYSCNQQDLDYLLITKNPMSNLTTKIFYTFSFTLFKFFLNLYSI